MTTAACARNSTLLNGTEEDHVQAVGRVRASRLLKVRVLVAAEVLFAMKCAAENNVHDVIKIDHVFYMNILS